MAGRFGSKFKKRTSHTTSNIKTQSSPTVSKSPPPRKTVSKPTPVRNTPRGSTLTSNISSTLSRIPSLDVVLPEAAAELIESRRDVTIDPIDDYVIPDDTTIDQTDSLENASDWREGDSYRQYIGDDIKQDDIVSGGFGGFAGDNNLIKGFSDWLTDWTQSYNPKEGGAVDSPTDNTDGQADPLAVYAQENPFTDGGDLPHATKNTIADAVIPAYTDEDGNKVEEKTVPYSDFAPGYHGGEVVGKTGAKIGIINDYITGEQRKSYYHPGSVSAEDHQAALDQQAIWQFENSIQSNYFKNITAGNMNDDMFKGLHDKIESSKVPKWKKEELWGEYTDKSTNYKSRSTYGGYEGLGSNTTHKTGKVDGVQASNWDFGNTTSWKPSKAETTKAKIDKDPLSVSGDDMAKFAVFTGQNIKPGGFDEFYNGTGTGSITSSTKINDKDDKIWVGSKNYDYISYNNDNNNKKNKPIWFDYKDLGY